MVPLGVENHLRKWKVDKKKITTFSWWEENKIKDINFIFTPAKHMSGRSLSDQKATLWGSWVLEGLDKKIYFSGDSGYGNHFKEIGNKYGPFNLSLLESGQYDEIWPHVHMMPEQTIRAGIDLKSKLIIPINWSSFTLANHSWTEPIERVTKKASAKVVPIATPQIGESIELGEKKFQQIDGGKNINR